MRRLWLIALLYVVAISLSACGDSPVSTPHSTDEKANGEAAGNNNSVDNSRAAGAIIDACSQVTREEVEAALGKTVMEPTRGDELVFRKEGALTSSCMFGSDDGFVSLDIKQQSPTSTIAWNAARSYGELRDLIGKGGGQPSVRLEEVAGLGAGAFAQTREEAENHETTELRVLSRRTILTIRVSALQSTSTLEVAKTVAGIVIPRLERYEGDAIVATPAKSPRPEANLDKDEDSKSPKRAQTERKSEKKVERASAQKSSKVAANRSGKAATRRANEPSSKVTRKSATRTPEKGKRETRKAARPTPKSRKRT